MANIPTRNNNPGDIKDMTTGQFRTYASPEEGYGALVNDLNTKISGKSKTGVTPQSSLRQFSSIYAPSSDNNDPESYAQNLAKQLGVLADTPISDLKDRVNEFAHAIARNEGYQGPDMMVAGTSQSAPQASTINDTSSPASPIKMSVSDFASKIKQKYPQYQDVDDSTLVNKMIAKYPVYADKVDTGNTTQSSSSLSNTNNTEREQPEHKNLLQKAGDFLTGSTQEFGKTAGQALAAGKNTELFSQALQQWTDIDSNLKLAIQKKKQAGGDTSRMESALQEHESSKPTQEQFTGDVINKSNEQVLGEAGGTVLEALSGGILGGGAETIASKELSVGQKLLKGAKLGATYGAIGSASEAAKKDEDLRHGAIDTAIGAGIGGALGGATEGLGVLLNKAGNFIARSSVVDKFIPETEQRIQAKANMVNEAKANIANEIKKAIPLTPTQLAKEEILFRKTGANAFSTMAEYGVIPGQEDAASKLQEVSDQFQNATRHAQNQEHAYFNLDEIRANAMAQADRNLPSLTARETAYKNINSEIDAAIKEGKDSIIEGPNGEKLAKSNVIERLRQAGNSMTPFNASDPQKIGRSTGYALSNAVRDQVDKEGTFAGYREANKQWGQIIHAQEILNKVKDSGKQLKTMGGLSGAITRKFLSGTIGLHTGGLGGLVLSELGSEYGAKVLSDPQLKTYFDRKLIERFGEKNPTPEAIHRLEQEIREEVDRRSRMLMLPAGDPSKIAIPMGAPAMQAPNKFANDIQQNATILNNTPQLPAPEPRLIVPNTQGTPNQPGVDYGTPEVGGMRQR